MIITWQIIILISLVLGICFFNNLKCQANNVKYQLQVKYYTDKHKRKGDRKHEQRN